MKQYWLINERSGDHIGAKVLQELRDASLEDLTLVPINFNKLSEQLEQAKDHHAIAVAGGDGTFATVLTDSNLPPVPVVTVPLGTANDLAIELGTSGAFAGRRWREMPALVQGLVETKLATWTLLMNGQERPFCNYASLGYEGAVVSDFSKWRATTPFRSKLANRAMYAVFGLRRLTESLPALTLGTAEEETISVAPKRGLLITNVKSHLGFGISSDQVYADDSRIECLAPSTLRDYLRMVASRYGFMTPLKPLVSSERLEVRGVPKGTPVQVDGEFFTESDGGPIEIKFRGLVKVMSKAPQAS